MTLLNRENQQERLNVKYQTISSENHPKELSDLQRQILLGTILGDDCIYLFKTCKNPKLLVYHSISQKEYAELKLKIWQNFVPYSQLKKTKRDKGTRVYFNACASKLFFPIYNMVYKNGKKIVTEEHLNQLTEISLAFWFSDDGSRCKNRGLAIHTNSFSFQEVEMICNYFLKKWGIICRPQKRAENQWVVFFSNKTSEKFSEIVLPYIHPSMRYKFECIYIKNPQRLYVIPFVYDNLFKKSL